MDREPWRAVIHGVTKSRTWLNWIKLNINYRPLFIRLESHNIYNILKFIISKRINNEEIVLEKELKGYKEYKKKVKYKMIPFIW